MKYGKAKFLSTILLILAFVFCSFTAVLAFPDNVPAEDVAESRDHPLISRFPGSLIRYHVSRDYDEFTLPFSELTEAEFSEDYQKYSDDNLRLEGKMTQHFYMVPDNHSPLEIFRNYEHALKNNDFEIIAQQEGNIEDRFYRELYSTVNFRDASGTTFDGVAPRGDGARYMAARLSRPEGDVYVSIYTAYHRFYGSRWPDGQPAVFQVVMEEKELLADFIEVDVDFVSIEDEDDEADDFPDNVLAEDVTDSRDHPLLSRFPGSFIRFYQYRDYDEFILPLSELTEADFAEGYQEYAEKDLRLEGRLTQYFYMIPDRHSPLEIFRNYEQALKDNGFEIVAIQNGNMEESFYRNLYSGVNFREASETTFDGVNSDNDSARYIAARLSRSEGDVYVSVYAATHGFHGSRWPDGQPAVFQVVMEETELMTDLISVDSVMQDIESRGRASIYGILFDVDSDQIKQESEPTIAKIADLMNDNPDLDLHVVGHTDSTGGLEYNIDLSERRAQSVVEALIGDYNIEAGRLNAFGVGPLSPTSTNETDEGKRQNRRVELVKP